MAHFHIQNLTFSYPEALSPALSDGLRTVWVVVVLLVSMAFLVGDSYNPFLYFRF